MSKSLAKMTKIELQLVIDGLQQRISTQDRLITVQQGQLMALKNQIDFTATSEVEPAPITRKGPTGQLSHREFCQDYCAIHGVRSVPFDAVRKARADGVIAC